MGTRGEKKKTAEVFWSPGRWVLKQLISVSSDWPPAYAGGSDRFDWPPAYAGGSDRFDGRLNIVVLVEFDLHRFVDVEDLFGLAVGDVHIQIVIDLVGKAVVFDVSKDGR